MKKDLTFVTCSSRTPGSLCNKLESTLRGLIIRRQCNKIRSENPHNGNIGKIMSFCYHLDSDKYRCLSVSELGQYLFVSSGSHGSILIHAKDLLMRIDLG